MAMDKRVLAQQAPGPHGDRFRTAMAELVETAFEDRYNRERALLMEDYHNGIVAEFTELRMADFRQIAGITSKGFARRVIGGVCK